MRRALVIGNWKMNGSSAENEALIKGLLPISAFLAESAVCVPYIYISQVNALLEGSSIGCGSQDVSVHDKGAYTGEISASMQADLGIGYVLVGHSERRQYHRESDELIAQKVIAAQSAGLKPVLCIGETLEEREAEKTLDVVGTQLQTVITAIGDSGLDNLVVAYEPVWAIGTGLTATPEQAQDVHQFIREKLGSAGEKIQILYGGSVKASNASDLFAKADIDGALVGGASLKVDEFTKIVEAATASQ